MMGPNNERAAQMISCFLAGVFVAFAFGLFAVAAKGWRDAYTQATECRSYTITELAQEPGPLEDCQ
jgi:hypothetical protein